MQERYSRQIIMPEIGEKGQEKLKQASVLVAGAGGLGSPVAFFLAAAGVGRIGIVDKDIVSLSNLNRQILHTQQDIGRKKIESAEELLKAFNPNICIETHDIWIDKDNADALIAGYDLVVFALDNPKARLVLNKACCKQKKSFIDAGIHDMQGYVTLVEPGKSACLECILGVQPVEGASPIPVLGATAGVLGSMEAMMAIRYILGLEVPAQSMIVFDGHSMEIDHIPTSRKTNCLACGNIK